MAKRADLDPQQQRALVALLAGASNEEAAQVAGVSVSRVGVWRKAEGFQAELRRTMERIRQECEANLLIRLRKSMKTIDDMQAAVLSDGSPDMEMRAEAAKMILTCGTRMISRYKELHVEGYMPPPMFIMPAGTRISTVRVLPEIPPPAGAAPVIEAEGRTVEQEG